MNEGVHVSGVEIVLFIPGRGRQHDIRVERRGVHAEVDIDHQVKLALRSLFVPLDVFNKLFRRFRSDGVGMSPKIVLEKIFMPLGTRHQGVTTPDDPESRPVFRRIGIFDGKFHLLLSQLFDGPVDNLLIVGGTGSLSLLDRLYRTAIKLGEEGKPTVAHRTDLMIHGMP